MNFCAKPFLKVNNKKVEKIEKKIKCLLLNEGKNYNRNISMKL